MDDLSTLMCCIRHSEIVLSASVWKSENLLMLDTKQIPLQIRLIELFKIYFELPFHIL